MSVEAKFSTDDAQELQLPQSPKRQWFRLPRRMLVGGGPAGRGWRGACGGGACEGAASARRSLWRGVPGGGCGGDRVAQCRREVECGAARECGAAFGGAGARSGRQGDAAVGRAGRSEEHTSELQSLMRISYAVFCLHKKNKS